MPRTRSGIKKLAAAAVPVAPVTEADVEVTAEQNKSIVSSQPNPPQKKKQVSTKTKLKSEDSHKKVEQIQNEPLVFPSTSSASPAEIQAEIPTKKVTPLPPKETTKTTRIILQRTPSIRKSFEGRLNWKNKHYNNAFTSTPIPAAKMPICSNKDIKTCFGFDDSDDANGSSFISPIFKEETEKQKPTRFNVKPRRPTIKTAAATTTTSTTSASIVPPTITSNTENIFDINIDIDTPIAEPMIPLSLSTNNKITVEDKEPKKPKKRRTKKTIEAENEEMEKWFENQKREFEDVENCPLMVVSINEEPKLL